MRRKRDNTVEGRVNAVKRLIANEKQKVELSKLKKILNDLRSKR